MSAYPLDLPPEQSSLNQRSVLIVGGGTFGTTTAYFLAKRGYKSVRVLDRWAPPALEAAGNDLRYVIHVMVVNNTNKVIRTDYPDPLYATLGAEAMKEWKNPDGLFSGLFHQSGWILAGSDASYDFIEKVNETAAKIGTEANKRVTPAEAQKRWSYFDGGMNKWHAYTNGSAGWAESGAALVRVADAARTAGVEWITGDDGFVKRLLFDENSTCIGALSASGRSHFADLVVLAAGPAAGTLLDFKGQIVAKGHTLCHIKLSLEDHKKYADMPMVNHLDGGLLFPPTADGIIKVTSCNFFTNYEGTETSLPRFRADNPSDDAPKPYTDVFRTFLKDLCSDLADRLWDSTRICWDGETLDYHFLISPHPEHRNLKLAVGGSAHGFKFFPVLGKYIVDMIEDKLDHDTASKWRWRPDIEPPHTEIHPFITPLRDLSDVPGWARKRTSSKL